MSRLLATALAVVALAPAVRADDPIPADTEVVTTASGLKYSVLKAGGDGARPAPGDKVRVNYTGWLPSGKMFDASKLHGGPAEFVIGEVIPGWNEALALMTVGARWKLTIPANLAYGPRGTPDGAIPPNATLIFEVELLSFTPGPKLPEFHKGDPAAQKKTESGVVYEPLTEGTGEAPTGDEAVEIKYALWDPAGKLLECSDVQPNPVVVKPSQLAPVVKFFPEAIKLLKPGARYRFEVPGGMAFGPRGRPGLDPAGLSIWEIELVTVHKPLPVPAFEMSKPENVRTTPSGLQIETLREGTGVSPKMGESVTVHYAGWLTNGKLFDNSYERGAPATFQLGRVIPGWNEGLQTMKEGGKARLTIPAQLAYGKQGQAGIPPDSTLVFVVELIRVAR